MGMVRVSELLALKSNDFSPVWVLEYAEHVPSWLPPAPAVADALPYMEARYLTHGPDCDEEGCSLDCYAHSAEVDHGGPKAYIEHLAEDMRKHGWREGYPPVAARAGVLYDGHHRVLAAALAGLEEIPARED